MNNAPLSNEELNWLGEQLLDHGSDDGILDISELDGFLTAIVSGPDVVLPSQWMPAMWGGVEPRWVNEKTAQRFHELVFRHMNDIAARLMTDPQGFQPLFYINEVDGEEVVTIEDWSFGYMRGVEVGGWPQLPEPFEAALAAIALHGTEEGFDYLDEVSMEEHQSSARDIEAAAVALHQYWLEQRRDLAPHSEIRVEPLRAEPKPGRNDLCSCGSGKKYKRCCLH